MSEEKEELSPLEKTLVCQVIAEEQGRLSSQLDRVRKKIDEGQKTYFYVGLGKEDIQEVRNRIMKIKEALHKAGKKISCSMEG